jgi:uncharacterized protein (DUF885 family)
MILFSRVLATLMILTSSLTALPVFAESNGDETTRFEQLYKAEWQWRQKQFAENEDSNAEQISPTLPNVSKAAQDERLGFWQDVLTRLDKIDVSQLSVQRQVDYLVYKNQIEGLISEQVFRLYEKPLSGDTSFWGNLVETARRTFKTELDYRNYLSQLQAFPLYFQQNIDNMRAGLQRGFTAPRVSLQGRDASAASVAQSTSAEDNVYYAPFKHMPASIPAAMQKELRDLGVAAINAQVIPAHAALLKFLREDYLPHAQLAIAAYDLPDGKAFYRSQIKLYTTLDLTPETIHQIGLEEVGKIRAEMADVMHEVKFEGELPAFLHFLRTDPQFYVKTPQALLERAAWICKLFDGKAKDFFGRLPRARFAIVPAPDDIAPFYTAGRGGPGTYTLNTYDLPSRPLYSLPALTLHESAPGHAFQMPLAAENQALPEFRRDSYISAYGEGWALYSERLGVEMGIYQTPYERFGMLSYQMWRAARLVVDTGIHAKGWTRQQAQEFLFANTALSTHEITTEVDRYIAWPGQALSYYLGEMEIWKQRARAEAALGEKFDIRAFHDAILELGSVPLPVLATRIDRLIAEGGQSKLDPAQQSASD